MLFRLTFFTLLGLGASALGNRAAAPTVVDPSTNITYVGLHTINGTIEKFLNIPYGADTSGPGRFANPRPAVIPPGSVINASAEGPVCPQVSEGGFVYMTNSTWFSEDCLRLKVARPAGVQAGDKLPVLVWIYGGSLWNGNINERTNEPDGLIVQSVANGLPVVFVAMNHRLNVFGFAQNDELNATDSLNVGLKDQRLALEWIQENIEHFGGDPTRVTVFGQSSGGLSATLQLLAYGGTKPSPFHGALMQSTVLETNITSTITRDTFAEVASLAGCAREGNAQGKPTIECLRALTMDELWNATEAAYDVMVEGTDGDIWLPCVDGTFLPAAPSELVRSGNFTQMPIVLGWARNDAALFKPLTIEKDSDTRDFLRSLYPYLSNETFEVLMELYPVSDFPANIVANRSAEHYRSSQILRDVLFTCPSFYFGHAMARKYHETSSSNIPVYIYEQNQTILTPYLESVDGPGHGVIHTSELAYVFGNFTPYEHTWPPKLIQPSAADHQLLQQMSRSWSTFAALGRPSLGSKNTLQGWEPAYGVDDDMMDASVYVVGGPNPGMSTLDGENANADVASQRLRERCGFLNEEDVIRQLRYYAVPPLYKFPDLDSSTQKVL
ncbi:Lipase 1 [Cytospora mali]|uniref:Carboxylic ester hydrolase n=1 Tax=Cytospora mali TaxID=578113 RepID=A0A194VSH6_CYTMA|nr:Lipase 1 [Valsa mali]